jgi:hypothetical protein
MTRDQRIWRTVNTVVPGAISTFAESIHQSINASTREPYYSPHSPCSVIKDTTFVCC